MGEAILVKFTKPEFDYSSPVKVSDEEAIKLLAEGPHPEWFSNKWYRDERKLIAGDIKRFGLASNLHAAFTIYWLSQRYGVTQREVVEGIVESLNDRGLRWTASKYRFSEGYGFENKWISFTGETLLLPFHSGTGGPLKGMYKAVRAGSLKEINIHKGRKGVTRRLRQLSEDWTDYLPREAIKSQVTSAPSVTEYLAAEIKKLGRRAAIRDLILATNLLDKAGLTYSKAWAAHLLIGATFSQSADCPPYLNLTPGQCEEVWTRTVAGVVPATAPKVTDKIRANLKKLSKHLPPDLR